MEAAAGSVPQNRRGEEDTRMAGGVRKAGESCTAMGAGAWGSYEPFTGGGRGGC